MLNPAQNFVSGLSKMYEDILRYNHENNHKSVALRSAVADIKAAIKEEPTPARPSRTAELTSAAEKIFHDFAPLLAAMGLEIRSNAERGGGMPADRDAQTLHLAANDCGQLAHALASISPRALETGDSHRTLGLLLGDLVSQFLAVREFGASNGERESLARGLPAALKEFERLGIPAGTLYLRIQQHKDGTLYEHLLAEGLQLTTPPAIQEFGPAQWHEDSNPQVYERRWRRALWGLQDISQNQNAQDLSAAAIRNLLSSAAVAREALELCIEQAQTEGVALPKGMSVEYILRNGEAFLEVLHRASGVLRGQFFLGEAFPEPEEQS